MDGTAEDIEVWARELPRRLKKMHSHWHSRDASVIDTHGKSFCERDVHFRVRLWSTRDGDRAGDCHVVPDHLKLGQCWSETAESRKRHFREFM